MQIQTINYAKPLRGLIFDMDDTMVKSMKTHFEAWTDLCLRHNAPNIDLDYSQGISAQNIEKVRMAYPGCTGEEFVQILFNNLSKKQIKELTAERENLFIENAVNLEEIKGLTDFLNHCDNLKLGIASSTSREGIEHVLNKLGLAKYFKPEHIIDPSKITHGKPHPEPFLNGAKAMGLPPENCLGFEDSRGGIKSVQSAGMKVVGVSTTISKDELLKLGVAKAIKDYTEINNMNELEKLFEVNA